MKILTETQAEYILLASHLKTVQAILGPGVCKYQVYTPEECCGATIWGLADIQEVHPEVKDLTLDEAQDFMKSIEGVLVQYGFEIMSQATIER
jgi:hypothetical protein